MPQDTAAAVAFLSLGWRKLGISTWAKDLVP
jgi:hypothetical protein